MKRIVVAAILCQFLLASSISNSALNPGDQDATIRILIVGDLQEVSVSDMLQQTIFLQQSWSNSDITANVDIEIVNGGLPVEFVLPSSSELTGTALQQLDLLHEFSYALVDPLNPQSLTWRDYFRADVIIGYVTDIPPAGGINICGAAYQNQWQSNGTSNNFSPVLNSSHPDFGLDLRGAVTHSVPGYPERPTYVATISLEDNGLCRDSKNSTAHEFGHILGTGHFTTPPNTVNSNARADRKLIALPGGGGGRGSTNWEVRVTVMASTIFDENCDQAVNNTCTLQKVYSDFANYGNILRRNVDTLDMTAKSVANYVRGESDATIDMCSDGIDNDGDGDVDSSDNMCAPGMTEEHDPPPPPPPVCDSTVMPFSMHAWLFQSCAFIGQIQEWGSHYKSVWGHACPQSVSHYEIWTSQPDGLPFVYGWDTAIPFSNVFISGPEGRIRVKSCGPAGCSPLSSSSALLFDICSM